MILKYAKFVRNRSSNVSVVLNEVMCATLISVNYTVPYVFPTGERPAKGGSDIAHDRVRS